MRTKTAFVMLLVAIFCSCCVTSVYEDETKPEPRVLRDVMVSTQKGGGTGVVISDDHRGTYVLTAGHVVIFAKVQENGLSIGKAISDDLSVTFSDGQIADAIFIAGDDERVDYAVLWIPKMVGTKQSAERPVRTISGEDLVVETFNPERRPGSYKAHGFWIRGLKLTEDDTEIMFGNSGAGVYDSSDKLVAILVSKDAEGRVGNVTLVYDVMKELKVMDLDWLIRDE